MPEPILMSIATALATKAAGGLFDLVKDKLAKRGRTDSTTIDAAARQGAGTAEITHLAEALEAAEREDPDFSRRLRTEWARISVTQRADSGGIANQIAGNVTGPVTTAVHFHAGPRDDAVVPSQLPAPPPYFTGRAEHFADLARHRVAQAGQPSLVVITGPGGVGKTALALRWLHDLRGEFPDGQLFADLGGFAAVEPAAPEQVLEGFLTALGLPKDRMPVSLSQRVALFRSMTVDRKIGLLLDNAASAAQVRPLLPSGPGCAVVVTGREQLSGLALDGARFTEVEPLADDESIDVLSRMLGPQRLDRELSQARELAQACGGLPLALLLVGARLATHPRRSLARELRELHGATARLGALSVAGDVSVAAVFDLSYHRLSPEVRRAYRLCGLHPGPEFAPPVIAAAAECPVRDAAGWLATLVDAHLADEIDEERLRLHDLLKLHSQRLSIAEDDLATRDHAIRRMIEWYLDTAVAADLLVHPLRERLGPRYASPPTSELFSDDREALRWLQHERTNLHAALKHAAGHDCDDVVWQFCEALWGSFLHIRRYDDWIEAHELGIEATQRLGNQPAQARLRSQLGFAYAKLGRYDEAIAENIAALALAEAMHDDQARATALSQLGRAARGTGEFQQALDYFAAARDLHESLGRRRGVALAQRRIGQILIELHRYDDAVRELDASKSTMAALGDRIQHARSLMYLGLAHARTARRDTAIALLQEALAAMRELDSPYYQAEILAALGDVSERAGDRDAAREYFGQALRNYRQVGDPQADRMRLRLELLAADR
jgi:tetratricopeptide (TPR) repeat protein